MRQVIATGRIEDWFAAGERVRTGDHTLFERVAGQAEAPWLTLLHGYPTCSYDWAPVADELSAERRLLMFDFLGFGDSDKPADHDYSIHEQADLTEAVWRRHGVTRTALVVHDYAVSVGQELLARRAEGALEVEIERIAFLNGGLYPDLHRARTIQKLLLHPRAGPLISRTVNERAFTRSLGQVFAPEHRPGREELREHWLGIERRGGHRIQHRLIRYIEDRRRHAERWRAGLEGTDVPRAFVWGMKDPVSGAHMAERIAERVPARELHALADVGHYPQLEAPQRVRLLLRRFVAPAAG
ncbi:MAG: alpha/beta hydrolase [Actinomycetota bacterium]|nr:alpha/beta hydrolase [Actinomycetota bacterium]